jgi:hypothetical protein
MILPAFRYGFKNDENMKIIKITFIVLLFTFVNMNEMGACTKFANPAENDLGWCKEAELHDGVFIGTCSAKNKPDPLYNNTCGMPWSLNNLS